MTVISSDGVLLQDIYVNNSAPGYKTTDLETYSNTDGADTIYANNITFRRWTVDNGDDSISTKANSTNILVEDCEFYSGLGVAIGSIGQYNNTFEYIENVTARNIITHNMPYGAYFKTWTGESKGYPPNGGGGGIGYASNLTFENFTIHNNSGIFAITQCTNYEGATGDCDTSKFNIHDVVVRNWTGTTNQDVVANLQCSAASPCPRITIEGINLLDTKNSTKPREYRCDSVVKPSGFNCTGPIVGENNA
jgi:galacturan 1,4-alpha-galacturonidase